METDPELGRYLDKGFAKRIAKSEAQLRFGSGTVGKLALIVNEKSDGSIKDALLWICCGLAARTGQRFQKESSDQGAPTLPTPSAGWQLKSERVREADPLDDLADARLSAAGKVVGVAIHDHA